MSTGSVKPFRITASPPDPLRRSLLRATLPAVEHALSLPALNDIYDEINRRQTDSQHFADTALQVLQARTRVLGNHPGRIPATGPLVVVANHPFGGSRG